MDRRYPSFGMHKLDRLLQALPDRADRAPPGPLHFQRLNWLSWKVSEACGVISLRLGLGRGFALIEVIRGRLFDRCWFVDSLDDMSNTTEVNGLTSQLQSKSIQFKSARATSSQR